MNSSNAKVLNFILDTLCNLCVIEVKTAKGSLVSERHFMKSLFAIQFNCSILNRQQSVW